MPDNITSPRRSPFARLLDKATRILAMRDHSEHELRRKLATPSAFAAKFAKEDEPEIAQEDIDKVIAWCYEHRWLDDVQFASRFIASRSRKGYGPQRIRQELKQKGIDRDIGESAMMACDIDWQPLARELAERKFGTPLPTEWQAKAKVQRFLLYRGFFMEDIQEIWRNFAD